MADRLLSAPFHISKTTASKPLRRELTDQADLILRTLTPGEDIPYNLLLLADETNYEDAISRSYYALYYAAKALLSSKGIITKTHKGLITQISEPLCNCGLVDLEIWHTSGLCESIEIQQD